MTDIIYDFISTGVDLILIGGVLSSLIIMLRGSAQLTTVISNQQATSTELDYYLQYHKYNDSVGMSSADALSALVGYRSDMNVFIVIPNGASYRTIYNDPATGKYYYKDGYRPSVNQYNPTSGTQMNYDQVATTLNSTWNYNSYLCTSGNKVFKKADFDRNTVVTAILLIQDSTDTTFGDQF
ncbi:MAG: hypothetical protein NC131_15020 [Roseburia sp.]|nr:hypothetical protein [Roseburia sp.]